MTAFMQPEQPQAPNPMMQGGPPAGGPPPNQMMPGAGGPQPPPAMPNPTPQQVAEFRTHIGAVVDGLLGLVSKPVGDLTKKDAFDAAAEMIAKGAFPTPETKQDLIVQLAQLPDDEPDLRKALGATLLNVSMIRAKLHEIHGPGEQPAPMMQGGGNV